MNVGQQSKTDPSVSYEAHNHLYCKNRRAWRTKPEFDYYLVIDFEATCDEGQRLRVRRDQMEIIEFPMVLVDAVQCPAQVVPHAEFQAYVKPEICPTLTKFCTSLTGITQEQVDLGSSFEEAMNSFCSFLAGIKIDGRSVCVVTWGNWDLETMLPQQMLHTFRLHRRKVQYPGVLKRWCNLKVPFRRAYKQKCGLDRAMKIIKKPMTGRHHSGLSDCHNTAKILLDLLNKRKVQVGITKQLDMAGFRRRAAEIWTKVQEDVIAEKAAADGPVKVLTKKSLETCKWDGQCRIGYGNEDFRNSRHWKKKLHLLQKEPVAFTQ